MKEEKNGFSGEYFTDIGTGTNSMESNEEDAVQSDLVTSTSEERVVEGTSGSSVEAHPKTTSDYYVAKPKKANIRARIIDDRCEA